MRRVVSRMPSVVQDVAEAEEGLDLLLELVDPTAGVVDPDLHDALLLGLAEHPGDVRPAGRHLLGDLRLRAALQVVEPGGDQQRGWVAG